MKKIMILIGYIITSHANAMLIPTFPKEMNAHVYNHIFTSSAYLSVQEVNGILKNLVRLNKSWNLAINDSENTLSLIKKLSERFGLSNMKVTEQLSTAGAQSRYGKQIAIFHYKNCKNLLKRGFDLNFTYGKHGDTALTKIICRPKNEYWGVDQWLIEHGADINVMAAYKQTAPMLAIEYFNENLIPLFLNHSKLNVHHQDEDGDTILHYCFKGLSCASYPYGIDFQRCKRMCSIIENLLQKGADPHLRNKDQETPIDLAKKTGYEQFLEILNRQYNS